MDFDAHSGILSGMYENQISSLKPEILSGFNTENLYTLLSLS